MYEIRQRKTDMRNQYLEKRDAVPEETRRLLDEKICQNILASRTYSGSDILLMYYPVRGEIDLRPVMRAAIAAGKRVAFPRVCDEDHSMTFFYVSSEADFEVGEYNIPEPKADLPAFDPEAETERNVTCLVPGVVFDVYGYRIGYGGGYYDRFLGKCRATTLGASYYSFILKDVPHGRFDISVDVMISERGIYAKR